MCKDITCNYKVLKNNENYYITEDGRLKLMDIILKK